MIVYPSVALFALLAVLVPLSRFLLRMAKGGRKRGKTKDKDQPQKQEEPPK